MISRWVGSRLRRFLCWVWRRSRLRGVETGGDFVLRNRLPVSPPLDADRAGAPRNIALDNRGDIRPAVKFAARGVLPNFHVGLAVLKITQDRYPVFFLHEPGLFFFVFMCHKVCSTAIPGMVQIS